MISTKVITRQWLSRVSNEKGWPDIHLLEKITRAALLIEGLSRAGMQCILKGGTAVLFSLDAPKRFSIDVDILVPEELDFEQYFSTIISQYPFNRYEIKKRAVRSSIRKHHYIFYYSSAYTNQANLEDHILLDVLVESSKYMKVHTNQVALPFLPQEGDPAFMEIPSIEDLLGDKLTAFAPNTTGIPYEKNGQSMSLEIIKQLYDVGTLFDVMDNMNVVSSVFKDVAAIEAEYRGLGIDYKDVLSDIISTALALSSRGKYRINDFRQLQEGIKRIRSYIFSENYQIEKAIVHAAKAAYTAALIYADELTVERYSGPQFNSFFSIDGKSLDFLKPLRKTNPEAYFYWYNTWKLLRGKMVFLSVGGVNDIKSSS
jgi:hypothetical protein